VAEVATFRMSRANGHAAIRADSFRRAGAGRPERILETSDFDHATVAHDLWVFSRGIYHSGRTQAPPRPSFSQLYRTNCFCRFAWVLQIP
jgi:hypothetical protein